MCATPHYITHIITTSPTSSLHHPHHHYITHIITTSPTSSLHHPHHHYITHIVTTSSHHRLHHPHHHLYHHYITTSPSPSITSPPSPSIFLLPFRFLVWSCAGRLQSPHGTAPLHGATGPLLEVHLKCTDVLKCLARPLHSLSILSLPLNSQSPHLPPAHLVL